MNRSHARRATAPIPHADERVHRTDADWTLAAIVGVDRNDRVQCECRGCGHPVYRQIHIILWPDGRIECWGSTCFSRELGAHRPGVQPSYGGGGRPLTDEEREMLRHNREQLVARFRAEHERQLAEEERRRAELEEANRLAAERDAASTETPGLDTPESIARLPRNAGAPWTSLTRPAPRLPPPPARGEPPPEPMDDPLYRQIRERLAAKWRAQGIDIDRPGQRVMFLENVRFKYEQARSPL